MQAVAEKNGKVSHEQASPELFNTPADRYLCEELEFDDVHKVIGEGGKTFDIFMPETDDKNMGWKVGRIVRVGGVHRSKLNPCDARETPLSKCERWGHRIIEDKFVPMFFKEGDIVMCALYGGQHIRLQGRKYFVMPQSDVIGKLG